MRRRRRIALFARPPRPGLAKTRLSPALPPALAAELASAMLEDAVRCVAGAVAEQRSVWWSEAADPALAAGLASAEQQGQDLGERLTHAFASLLRSDHDRALVAGSDTPGLTSAHLEAAFERLESHDVVLGPANDGGYWAIGLRRAAPSLFRDIAWSTRGVLQATLERAHEAGLSVALTATLADLDTPADLAHLVGETARSRSTCGPALRAALRRVGLAPDWGA